MGEGAEGASVAMSSYFCANQFGRLELSVVTTHLLPPLDQCLCHVSLSSPVFSLENAVRLPRTQRQKRLDLE
jgi:hypothetical protein